MLCHRWGLQRVKDTTVLSQCIDEEAQILDYWTALDRARSLRWLDPTSEEGEEMLDVELACHYAQPANGGVHVLVPGKLLLFQHPAALPPGQDWADDARAPDQRPARRFSAAFFADLLVDLGVSAVVYEDRAAAGDRAAFSELGLDVHELGLDPRRPALLGAMDRLLAVARAAPGAVAVFGGGGADGVVGTLAAAWLMREYGFGGEAARAWLRLVCPALPGDAAVAEQ